MARIAPAIGLCCLFASACVYQVQTAAPPTQVTDAAWMPMNPNYAPGSAVVATLTLQSGGVAAPDVDVEIQYTVTNGNITTTFVTQLDDVSDSAGYVRVLVTAAGNANVTLSASIRAQNGNITLTPLTVVFSGPTSGTAAPSRVTLTVPATAVTGTAEAMVVSFTDNQNNPVNFTGTLHFTSSDGAAALPANTNVTAQPVAWFQSGVTFHTINGPPPAAQTVQVVATTNNGTVLAASAQVSVTPASAYFSVAASPNNVPVGIPTSLTITLYNQDGTVAAAPTNASIVVTSPSDAMATLAPAVTMTSNPFPWHNAVTFHASATQTALVSNSDYSLQGSAAVTVTPGNANSFSIASTPSAQAGAARTVTVSALDVYGNVATTYTGTVAFSFGTSTSGSITPLSVQAQQGIAQTTVICDLTPDCVVTATDGTYDANITLQVTPAAPKALVLMNLPKDTNATVPFAFNVASIDSYGNTSTWLGAVTFSSSDPRATLPPVSSFIASDGGFRGFSATLRTVGTPTLTVRDAAGALSSSTQTVNVHSLSGQPAQLSLNVPSNIVPCAPLTATVSITDGGGAVVANSNAFVTLSATASPAQGALIGTTTVQAVNGIATFNHVYVNNETATVTYTFTASSGSLSGTAAAVATPGTPTVNFVSANTVATTGCVDITFNVTNSCGMHVPLAVQPAGGNSFLPRAAAGTLTGLSHVGFQDGNVTFTWDVTHDVPHYAGAVTLQYSDTGSTSFNINTTSQFQSTGYTAPTPPAVTAFAGVEDYATGVRSLVYPNPGAGIVVQPVTSTGVFGTSTTISVLGTITAMAAANLNHDGNNMAVVCLNSNSLSVYSLNPNSPSLGIAVAGLPCGGIGLADINHDNHDDVITANGNTLAVYLNSGVSPYFGSPAQTFTLNANVLTYRVGYTIDTGNVDIVALTDAPALLTYAISPNGVLQNPTNTSLPGTYGSLGLGDIDRDGLADAVLEAGGAAIWLKNLGNGQFGNASTTATTGPIYGVFDINRDDAPDVLSYNASQIAVTYGTGASLQPNATIIAPQGAQRLAALDINRDGWLDYVSLATGATAGTLASWFQTAPQLCAHELEGVRAGIASSNMVMGTTGDFNGDSITDMAFATSGNQIWVNLGNGAEGSGNTLGSNVSALHLLPVAPASGDLNGDGNTDLALVQANSGGSGLLLSMYLGNGGGTLTHASDILLNTADMGVTNLVLTDVNKDGVTDAVIGDSNTTDLGGALSIIFSPIASTTEYRTRVGSGYALNEISVIDMNGDLVPDVVSFAPNDPNTVHVLINAGTGTFTDVASTAPGAQMMALGQVVSLTPSVVAIGASSPAPITVYLWDGNSTFTGTNAAGSLDLGCVPSAMQVVDFDNYARGDLAVLCGGQARVSVWYNHNGATPVTFLRHSNIPVLLNSSQLFVTDFDTDGSPDIGAYEPGVGMTWARNAVNPYFAVEGVGFIGADDALLPSTDANNINQALTLTDYYNDGFWDLAYLSGTSSNANLMVSLGSSGFAPSSTTPVASYPSGTYLMESADFNRDGVGDFVIVGSGTLSVRYGCTPSCPTPQTWSTPATIGYLAVGDINNDGWADILLGANSPAGTVYVYLNNQNALFGTPATVSVSPITTMALGDVTGDSRLDLIVGDATKFSVYAWQSTALALTGAATTYAGGANQTPVDMRVVDMNHDGLMDVVMESLTNANTTVIIVQYLNNGNTTFNVPPTRMFPTQAPLPAGHMAVGDFDNDGWVDMVFVAGESLLGFVSSSPDNFNVQYYSESAQPQGLVAADMNRDGIADVTVLVSPAAVTVPMTHQVGTLFGR